MLSFKRNKIDVDNVDYVLETHKLIEYRNHQLTKGFIYKGYEECSFNEFYSNGNENILKYAGIINGLQKTHSEIFINISDDLANKMKVIIDLSRELIKENDNHLALYNKFFRAAEYCLVVCCDEVFLYSNLYSKKDLKAIYDLLLEKENYENDNIYIQKTEEATSKYSRQIAINKRVLENNKNLKRNAYYSIKKLEQFLEKIDTKSDNEMKSFYNSKIKKQLEEKEYLSNSIDDRRGDNFIYQRSN